MKHLVKNQSAKTSIFALLIIIFVVLGCNRLTAFKANMFEGNNAEKAVSEVKAKIGKPFKITEVMIEKNELRIQAQDPNNPKNLDEYKYVSGFIVEPNPVKLNAMNDKLDQSAFPIDEINFAAVPQIVADALKQTAVEGGTVRRMTFQRGFAIVGNSAGSLGNARWNIEVVGTRENASAAANPQGKVVGVNLSQTSRGADYRVTTREELEKVQTALKEVLGANAKIYKILIYDKYFMAEIPNAENPKATDTYKFDVNGLTKGGLVPGVISGTHNELFSIADIDLTKVPEYIEKTRNRTALPDGTIGSISIQRTTISVMDKSFYTTLDVSLQSGVKRGMVVYDLANGEEVRVYKNGEIISRREVKSKE